MTNSPIIHSVEDKEVDDRGPQKTFQFNNPSIKDDAFTKSRRTKVSITISSNQAASYTALHGKEQLDADKEFAKII